MAKRKLKDSAQKHVRIESVLVERGSGNVFADIGLPNPEEALAKAGLVSEINDLIEGKTQEQAAKLLRIDQPKVSALKHGHLMDFSVERLLRFLMRLGRDVMIETRPAQQVGGKATVGHLHVRHRVR